MEILKIANQDIHRIKPLWETLNQHHLEHSTHFKAHFKAFTFEERLKQLESKDGVAVFVAEEQAELVGYCMASIKAHEGEIDSIFVKPIYRNQMVGERLIQSAESWLEASGAVKLIVCVAEGNEQAFGFYNRHDYLQRYTVFEKDAREETG
ncbi:MAG: GNAT family N-acetyltransferase [Desulfobacterales bacterium]|nr:GNAT family N-acetyltransferase [Desulfobacterales bacterium]